MSDEQFPAPGPGDLAPARKAGSREHASAPPPAEEQISGEQVSGRAQPGDHQLRYQAQPPEYQPQPPGYQAQPQPQPAQQPQPTHPQPGPEYQYQYQQQPQYQYQQYGYQQSYFQQPQLAQKSGRSSPWLIAVAAIALLVPVAVGGWYLLGRGGGETTKPGRDPGQQGAEQSTPEEDDQQSDPTPESGVNWPTNPQLQHSFTVNIDPEDPYPIVPIEGTVDDLLIGETNGATSRVTRYVDGVAAWQSDIGLGNTGYLYQDDDILILNSSSADYDSDSIVRLDPETGSKIWEVTSTRSIIFQFIEDRLFLLEQDFGPNKVDQVLSEHDPDSGKQLNRIEGPSFETLEDEFVLTDPVELTAQLLDLDFQPIGGAVAVEPSGSQSQAVVVTRYEDGWIYYADRTITGGEISIVGISDTGDRLFECPVSIDDASEVELRDGSTLILSQSSAVEVLDFEANTCTPRWSREATGNGVVSAFSDYVDVYTYNYDDNNTFIDADIEVLDWNTGEVIASGKNTLFIVDDQMITFEGSTLVMKRLSDGEVAWSIPAPGETNVSAANDWLSIVTEDGATASVDIYAD